MCKKIKQVFFLKFISLAIVLLVTGLNSFAQKKSVQGTVIDGSTGSPISGVSILIKGTKIGTTSNSEGKFEMNVSSGASVLTFTSVGYTPVEEAVGNRTEITVTMHRAGAEGLEEVVVIGFGTQKAEDLTASIDTANAALITSQPVSNVGDALQGQLAGLEVSSNSGRPGEDVSIVIRGRRSLSASNQPLLVVDGMPFDGILSDISPQTIKSISVLKDAAATAVYGSRGANGVILITTKGGGDRPTQVGYSGYYGVTTPMLWADMMNGPQFADMKREASRQKVDGNGNVSFAWDGELPSYQDALQPEEFTGFQDGVSTNWPRLIMQNGNRQNHNLSISGGNSQTQFYVSGSYMRERALIPTDLYNRYGLQINLTHHIGKKFTLGVTSSFSRIEKNYNMDTITGIGGPLDEAYLTSPLGKPRDADGNLIFFPISDGLRSNPLLDIQPGAMLNEIREYKVFSTLSAEYKILNNFSYKLSFAPDYSNQRTGIFVGSETTVNRGGDATARKRNQQVFDYVLQNQLNYNTSFGNGDHKLDILALQSIEKNHLEANGISVRGLPLNSQSFNNLGAALAIDSVNSALQDWQLASFLGRINYQFKGKYLLQMSARADGSSRLSPGNKWNVFPGISGGWRISRESFMEDVNIFNDLKLRVSYGMVGNTAIAPYQTQGALARTVYAWDNDGAYGYGLANIPNPDLTWEKTSTYDIGLDFTIANGRVSGSLDYYNSKTKDLLLERLIPLTTGYDHILQNIGKTSNNGFEISIRSVNFRGGGEDGFNWVTQFNWSRYREKILQLFNSTQDDIGNGWFIGHPIEVFYDYQKIGIWQSHDVDEAAKYGQVPGEIRVKDQDNNGVINGDDRVILGSPEPKWAAGMTNMFSYKGFDLTILINTRIGGLLRSDFHSDYNTLFGRYNNLNVDYWTPDNPTNAYPRPNLNQERAVYNTSMNIFNADYLKIKNITLGYNFPSSLMGKWGFNRLRVYLSVENVKVFSDYKVQDPSLAGAVGSNIPTPRAFLFGLDFNF